MKTRQIHMVIEEEAYQALRQIAFTASISVGEYIRRLIQADRANMEQEDHARQ